MIWLVELRRTYNYLEFSLSPLEDYYCTIIEVEVEYQEISLAHNFKGWKPNWNVFENKFAIPIHNIKVLWCSTIKDEMGIESACVF